MRRGPGGASWDMPRPLTTEEIERSLSGLPGWVERERALEKIFCFTSFQAAMGFMARAAVEAEAMDHHPEWTNTYRRVRVRLSTHDVGGRVTALDVELARRFERVAGKGAE